MVTSIPIRRDEARSDAMFATIGNTFDLMKQSWRVLMRDRELVLFPIMGALTIAIVAGIFAILASATGTLDRIDVATGGAAEGESTQAIDAILAALFYAATTFVVIFFNAALIAAAIERLRGGDPTVRSGLRVAASHLPAILGWSLIAATIGLILQALRSRSEGILGQIAISIAGGVWAYMTFFVVPMMVVEGVGPVQAIKRSGSLFKETWGQQAVSSFGFGIVYIGAVLVAVLPVAVLFAVSPVLALVVGLPLIAMAIGIVQALEGIFKAALYEFARGGTPQGFEGTVLRDAYRAM